MGQSAYLNRSWRDEEGYYDDETPSDFVDVVFMLVMVILHLDYAFKFTDYSLSHIHIKKNTLDPSEAATNSDEDEKEDEDGQLILKTSEEAKPRPQRREEPTVLETYSTQSQSNSNRRKRSAKICCFLACAPRLLTWRRTYLIRTFLRVYFALSCLLAMVLYIEFFMNLFVEYGISCVVNQGYWVGFLLVPFLIFVSRILLLLAWQALVVTWNINCDSNGDLEAIES